MYRAFINIGVRFNYTCFRCRPITQNNRSGKLLICNCKTSAQNLISLRARCTEMYVFIPRRRVIPLPLFYFAAKAQANCEFLLKHEMKSKYTTNKMYTSFRLFVSSVCVFCAPGESNFAQSKRFKPQNRVVETICERQKKLLLGLLRGNFTHSLSPSWHFSNRTPNKQKHMHRRFAKKREWNLLYVPARGMRKYIFAKICITLRSRGYMCKRQIALCVE